MASKTVVAAGFLGLLVAASSARPEEPAARVSEPAPAWRVIVGPSLILPAFDATYVSTYSPPFQCVEHTSTATQTLPLDAGKGPGLWLGVERALGRHVGLQLSAHYGEADLSGAPGQYDLTMRYTSRPLPGQRGCIRRAVRRASCTPSTTWPGTRPPSTRTTVELSFFRASIALSFRF